MIAIAEETTGNADLVAYFLLRMSEVAHSIGTLATNTISQGDTREVGLDRLVDDGAVVHRAVKTAPWPSEAGVEIAKLWLWHGPWAGRCILDDVAVGAITSSLTPEGRATGTPYRLRALEDRSFQGSVVVGTGFILEHHEAREILASEPASRDVIQPYLSGADLYEDPRQLASRSIINFFDWSLERAKAYDACFRIVEQLVKPERMKVNRNAHRERWWIYGDKRPALYRAVRGLDRVIAIAQTSKTVVPAFVDPRQVIAMMCIVFPYDDDAHLGLLTSAQHWWWAHKWCSTMRSAGLRYSPTDAFETFPQPEPQSGPRWDAIADAGKALSEFRADLMIRTNLGLTKTYNRVHNPDERDPDVARLRELHVELDRAARDAYGWSEMALDHDHWETPQGMRFTVSPAAKDELLDRLLELNHERYAAEVAAGLHDKKGRGKAPMKRAARVATRGQGSIL